MAEHIHPANSTQRWIGCPGCDAEAVDDLNAIAEDVVVGRVRGTRRLPSDLEADLRARWRPSPTQLDEARVAFAEEAPEGQLYTIHLLVNRRPGWWTGNEDVRPIEGRVYRTRDEALEAATLAEKVASIALSGISVCAGWTAHNPNGTWEVYEL